MKPKFSKNFYIVLFIVILLIIAGFWFYFGGKASKIGGLASKENGQVQIGLQAGEYKNAEFGFSFEKPDGYTVGEFDQAEGKMILVQSSLRTPGVRKNEGFQILITPFDEPDAVITRARINKDIPDMKVENSKEISVAGKDTQGSPMYTKGLEFESNNQAFGGSSAEVWFVHGNNLYQLSGYHDSMSLMESVIQSWKFE